MTWVCRICRKEFESRKLGRDHFKKEHKSQWKQMRKDNPSFVISDQIGRDI